MTGEAAIRIHKQSVVRKSIYGRHVRMSDLILTGLISVSYTHLTLPTIA